MRRIIVFFVLGSLQLLAFAQLPSTRTEILKYVNENLLSLNPIEGRFNILQYAYPGPVAKSNGIKETMIMEPIFWIYYDTQKDIYITFKEENNGSLRKLGFEIRQVSSDSYIISINGNSSRFTNPNNFEIYDDSRPQNANVRTCFSKSYPTPEMIKEAAKEKVWSGSGFALKNGYIITNHHVIEGASSILIQGVNGDFYTDYKAVVIASDQANDIALLKIIDERFKGFGNIPYQLHNMISDVGEAVFALGYPMADIMGKEIKFTDGRISSRTGIQGAANTYQITVPIQPGNSGGPLFDQQGRIIGITTSSLNKDVFDAENVNYAVKAVYIINLIENAVGKSILPTGTGLTKLNIPQKIKAVKNYIFYISCKGKG